MSPAEAGFRPRLASRIAFSMVWPSFFSNGCTPMVRPSISEILAT
jgi:hypothetical protein